MLKHTHKGHCQGCGRVQAIIGRSMAKHGYQVKFGAFMGTCPGSNKAPLEFEKTFTESQIDYCNEQALIAHDVAVKLKSGEFVPATVKIGQRYEGGSRFSDVRVAWNAATEFQQRQELQYQLTLAETKREQMQRFASELTLLAKTFHGKELIRNAC